MAITSTKAAFVKSGDTIDVLPSDPITCGTIKNIAGCRCIALWDLPALQRGTMKILHRGEVIRVTTNEAIGATDMGVAIYITGDGIVTKTSEGNTPLGFTAEAVASGALSFDVVCA